MCQSKAEGGQRCYSHAKNRVTAATSRYEDAVAAGDRAAIQKAWNDLTVTQEDLASTPQGATELREARDAAEHTDPRLHKHLTDVVTAGEYLKARNKALHQAAKDIAEGRHPLGRTGHEGRDRMIAIAVRDALADPDAYRDGDYSRRIPGVKTYATRQEQATGVGHWIGRTSAYADAYEDFRAQQGVTVGFIENLRQLGDPDAGRENPEDVGRWFAPTDAFASRAGAESRKYAGALLISAHRLALAQRQTPAV